MPRHCASPLLLLLLLLLPGAAAAAAAAAGSGKWTILVYEVADNDLECAGLDDLREMASGLANAPGKGSGTEPDVIVLADMGRSGTPGGCRGDVAGTAAWSGTKELRVRLDGTIETLSDTGQQNLGRSDELAAFITRSLDAYPVGPDRCCSPRHRMPFDSSNEGSKCGGGRSRHYPTCPSIRPTAPR